MAINDIVQTIAESRVDARSLSEFVFKPAGFKVARRLAPPVDTLQFYIDRFNSLNGDFSSSVSVALSSLNNSVAEADDKVAYIETTVQDAISQSILSSGFVTIDSFELGATITQRNQALRHTATGKLYRWAGNLPKVVDASSTPDSAGGIGENAWMEVSDTVLRQELAASGGVLKVANTDITFNNVADMQAANWLAVGMVVKTLGYHSPSDDGEMSYEIVASGTGVADLGTYIALSNGLQAKAKFGVNLRPEYWGAYGDTLNDDTVAIQAALEYARRYSLEPEKKRVLFGTKKYRFTAQLDMSRCAIESQDAELLKDFSGTGVLAAGGARYTDFYGDLIISGHGAHFTDGYSPTTDAESHGIQFSGRLKIHGSVLSRNHWGHGVLIDAYSNMNKCSINFLKADYNAGKGIYGKSINNDCSVWTIKTETYGNYNGGVYFEDTFSGRQWDWNCYNEASRNPDMEAGVYLGRFRRSNIFIYSEEQATTNPELVIGAACEDLDINDTRNNRTDNRAPLTCVTRKGYVPQYRSAGVEVATIQDRVLVGLSNAVGARVNFLTLGAGDKSFLRDVYTGNGGWSRSAYNPDAPTGRSSSLGVYTDRVSLHGYGQSLGALVYIRDANGTQDLPTQKIAGEYACNLVGSIYTGASYTDAYRIRARLATVGSGNKASTDLEFGAATSVGGVTSTMILRANGTLDVAAGITPFTGMHKATSSIKLESGMAVDVVDVVNNIMTVELSKTANSKRCAGVVNHCELLDDGSYLVYVAAVGDSHTTQLTGFKVNNEGGDIEAGDILVTASEQGYLCKAADGLHESVTRFKAMQDAIFIGNKAEIYGYFK